MQMDEAAALRKIWGDKPCRHPELDREYYRGAHTGDVVCTTCGRSFSSEEAAERHAERQRQAGAKP